MARPRINVWPASCAVWAVLCSLLLFVNNGMIEDTSAHIGYEVRSLHQFKYDYHGSMTMEAKAKFRELLIPLVKDGETQMIKQNLVIEKKANRVEKFTRRLLSDTDDIDDIDDIDSAPIQQVGKDSNVASALLYLYHCSDNELSKLDEYSDMSDLCNDISLKTSADDDLSNDASAEYDTANSFDCSWSSVISYENPVVSYTFESSKTQWMTLIGINCDESKSFSVNLNIEAQNGNGEYLSLSEIPYKPLYLYLGGVWAFVSIFWFIHWYRYSIFNVAIHQLVTFVPIFMSVSCLVWHFYWNYCSVYGTASQHYTLLAYIASSLADAWIALCLMFIAEGWGILRGEFETWYKAGEVFGIFLLVFISDVLTNYYTSLLILLVISYVLTLRRVLNGYTCMMRLLNTQHEILASVDYNTAMYDMSHPLNVKLQIYKSFQKCVILFIGCEVVYYWGSSFLIETPWINTILSNCIIFSLVVYVGWEFRMRPFRPNFHLFVTSEASQQEEDVDENEYDYILTEEWRPGDITPLFPKDYNTWLSSNNGEIVVMLNEVDKMDNPPGNDDNNSDSESESSSLDSSSNNNRNDKKKNKNKSEIICKYSIGTPIVSYIGNKIGPFKEDLHRRRLRQQRRHRQQQEQHHQQQQYSSYSNYSSYQNDSTRRIDMSGADVVHMNNNYNININNNNDMDDIEEEQDLHGMNRLNYEGAGLLDNTSDDEYN